MLTLFSVVTSVKDYIEIVHKVVENNKDIDLNSYYDFGTILTYLIICVKTFLKDFLSFNWFSNLWSLPIVIPNIASSIISEVSILDGYFHNLFTFLENPISYTNNNIFFYSLEKFTIGLINSLFLCLPTSTAHIITVRRFVVQGLEAGYISGLGTIAGNLVWLTSIIFGFRFIIIPWLSLDILRYILGFSLLVKYMWDSYNEKRNINEDLSKSKIFLLTFLLSFTEQTNLFPFLTNLSLSADSTILESFSTTNLSEFFIVHIAYLSGILVGSFSLLNFTCWFWENPAFKLYIWAVSSFKISTSTYYNYLNFFFLYATMLCTISSIPYFGLDYTITNPLGLIHEDRILEEKSLLETSFLNSKGSDKNTRQTKRGRRGRNEKWKRRVERYRGFDTSLYDQGIYDLFTIEDLNYGFDRFWLRRKMKRSNKGFRLFPGAWMRSFKKQMSKAQLESLNAPRLDFFRLLFEQAYNKSFHERKLEIKDSKLFNAENLTKDSFKNLPLVNKQIENTSLSLYMNNSKYQNKKNVMDENSALRKFIRKTNQRLANAKITSNILNSKIDKLNNLDTVYSKRWKSIFSKLSKPKLDKNISLNAISNNLLIQQKEFKNNYFSLNKEQGYSLEQNKNENNNLDHFNNFKSRSGLINRLNSEKILTKKERQILNYRSFIVLNDKNNEYKPLTLLHPLKFYLQKNKAFERKLKFYGTKIYRNFQTENNAPYFRVMMKRLFYNYKPNLRWEQTMTRARSRIMRKKHSRMARKLNINKNNKAFLNIYNEKNLTNAQYSSKNKAIKVNNFIDLNVESQMNQSNINILSTDNIQKPTNLYSIISKNATRYRHQVYKDVLQHWYYLPFNRILLKLDIDSFIRRQPFSHFVTNKEENLLHLRRVLLSDHYNTLRWYNFMEHYETMKTKIGSTKSFSSKIYNQQFHGTFKKIRHLFALTPSLNQIGNFKNNFDNPFMEKNLKEKNQNFGFKILKFDQVLYNEFPNTGNSKLKLEQNTNNPNSFIHEELLNKNNLNASQKDLLNQSSEIIRQYIINSIPIREALIKKFLTDKNYSELSKFLWRGGKIRGVETLSNENKTLTQETNLLSLENNPEQLKAKYSEKIQSLLKNESLQKNLWLSLLKQSKNLLYNRETLKNYLTKKVSKYKKRKQFKEKNLKRRIERIEKWLLNKNLEQNSNDFKTQVVSETSNLSTAIRKAIKETMKQSIEISNISDLTKNKLPIKLLLKRSNVSSYLNNKLKSKQLLSIYSLNKFKKYVTQIEKSLSNHDQSNILVSPTAPKKMINRIGYRLTKKFTNFSLKPFIKLFKTVYMNTSSLFLQEQKTKNLSFWKAKTKFTERKNQERKKLSSVMPKLDLQKNMEEKKARINNTIIKLNLEKNDFNFYNNSINENLKPLNFNVYPLTKNQNPREPVESRGSETFGRKKTDLENNWNQLSTKKQVQSWNKILESNVLDNKKNIQFFLLKNIFEKKFVTKSKRRTTFVRMVRSPSEILHKKVQLKRQFTRNITNKNLTDLKNQLFELEINNSQLSSVFKPASENIKQRKRTSFWQKNKAIKGKISSRKMRHSSLGKLKMIAKKYKKIQNYNEIRKWWWQNFLPNFKAKIDILLELDTNIESKNKFLNLSNSEILKRDSKNYENYLERVPGEKNLQIGNKDYKPLNIPQSIRLRQELMKKNILNFNIESEQPSLDFLPLEIKKEKSTNNKQLQLSQNEKLSNNLPTGPYSPTLESNKNSLNQLYENILIPRNSVNSVYFNTTKFMFAINPVPFYGGWDESLRKFVVTNRLLSKTKAGYEMNFTTSNLKNYGTLKTLKTNKFKFDNAPLEGMNLATILYWKIPFSPYDQDQFFNVGIDGFAPIGWRRFNFTHSTKTIQPLLVTTKIVTNGNFLKNKKSNKLLYQIKAKLFNNHLSTKFKKSNSNNIKKKIKRRIMQRIQNYDRSRDTMRFPSGSLINQILPLHYLNVFYKRSRLPGDRYIKRRLRRDQKKVPFNLKNLNTNLQELTLRKRIKPRRRYHRKNSNTQKIELLPRRRSFRKDIKVEHASIANFLNRPVGKEKSLGISFDNKILSKNKKRLKNQSKQDSTNIRIRRLRKRVKQQIIRLNPRYKPNTGGFIWPGDYLRLELKKAPKLEIKNIENETFKNQRKQSKRLLKELPLPLQPKKYLLQKHNLKVLKRRLEKSQNINKLHQKLNELKFLLNN